MIYVRFRWARGAGYRDDKASCDFVFDFNNVLIDVLRCDGTQWSSPPVPVGDSARPSFRISHSTPACPVVDQLDSDFVDPQLCLVVYNDA